MILITNKYYCNVMLVGNLTKNVIRNTEQMDSSKT